MYVVGDIWRDRFPWLWNLPMLAHSSVRFVFATARALQAYATKIPVRV